jgi:site-specific DNA recombinase
MDDYIDTVFGPEGLLARRFPGYAPRPGQIALARAVDAAIRYGEHLMAEAPTGTGKSLAYLVPASYHAAEHGRRVVVVTANIALQEQLVAKDLPLLAEMLPWRVRFELLKGRQNYLCPSRMHEEKAQAAFDVLAHPGDARMHHAIVAWAALTETGDVSELPFEPPARLWRQFSTTSEDCKGSDCRFRDQCFALKASERAAIGESQHPLRHLHAQVHVGRPRTGVHLARCPARGLRAVHRQPRASWLGGRVRALRRRRGFTGANLERPAFQCLLADIDASKVDIVVTYKVDRLSRSLLDFARIMDRFQKAGVSFVSITQNFSTADAMGRLTLNMLMSFAEFEREMIAERTRDKMAAARKKGKWLGGRPPLGYDVEDRRLIPNSRETEMVRALFRIYEEEQSLIATADALNARGVRTKSWVTRTGKRLGGTPWDKKSVYRVLTNLTYTGMVLYEGDIYEGEHEPIVDEDTFQRVQAILRRNGTRGGAAKQCRHDFLLRGLLRCQVCGSHMSPRWSTSRGREYRYYVCTKVERSGTKACSVRSIPAGAIEDFVVQHIRTLATEPELLGRVVEALSERRTGALPALEAEHAGLEAEHRGCCDEARGVFHALGDRDTQRSRMATERLAELDERAGQLERRLAELRDEIEALEREQVTMVEVARAMSLFDPVWEVLHHRERGRILHLLLETVQYDGEKGEVALTFYPLGITRLAAEAQGIGAPAMEAAS